MAEPNAATKQFESAVAANMARLIGLARSMLGGQIRDAKQAEDLVQDALLKLFRYHARYDWSDGGWSLMAKAVSRNVISCRRRKLGQSLDADAAMMDSLGEDQDPATIPMTREAIDMVRQYMAGLPDNWRQAMVLREQQDMGYREIAEVMNATEAQVKTWLHRGRLRLGELLREHMLEK